MIVPCRAGAGDTDIVATARGRFYSRRARREATLSTQDEVVSETAATLRDRHVLLAVGGGIAAYKAAEVTRLLVRAGARVDVALTQAAQRFVTALTFQALSQRPVATNLLDPSEEQQIGHIGLADRAELILVAPATADLCARVRMGLADDVVTATLLAARSPILLAPSMNVHMWNHAATRENIAVLQQRGYHQVGPGSGEMACGHVGDGRLAEPWEIVLAAARLLARQDLRGRKVLVTAGPTREHIDPVRFISNPSSGRMGYAIATAAALRGAKVTLVSGPVSLAPPHDVQLVPVTSAAEMAAAVEGAAGEMDVIFMTAAVSDYQPRQTHTQKVKKSDGPESIVFDRTPDVLATLGQRFAGKAGRPFLVGFAAETERIIENAREKLVRKGCDLVVANFVGQGGAFGSVENEVTFVTATGERPLERASKDTIAWRLLDEVAARIPKSV
jgi:phosphopantothenoylcysteine decarboxylase/phosphopantothenate--cysteine ligase